MLALVVFVLVGFMHAAEKPVCPPSGTGMDAAAGRCSVARSFAPLVPAPPASSPFNRPEAGI